MPELQSPELLNRLSQLKTKASLGTLTMDEMREVIIALRAGRVSAQQATPTKSKSKGPVNVDSLLADLEGL